MTEWSEPISPEQAEALAQRWRDAYAKANGKPAPDLHWKDDRFRIKVCSGQWSSRSVSMLEYAIEILEKQVTVS